jgi:hypothetical protein
MVGLLPTHKKLVEGDVIVQLDTNSMLLLTASDLASEAFHNQLEAEVGSALTVSTTFDSDAGNIRVSIEADSKKTAQSAATLIIAEAKQSYARGFSRPAAESLTRLTGLVDAATARRKDIEASLQQTPPGPLADGLILDLEQQSTQVSKIQASAAALTTIVADAKNELQATSIETSKTHNIILYPVGLAIAAALLCAGWIVARAALDRKVRTRRDLDRLGIHSLVGSLPVSYDAKDAAIVGAAISSASADQKSHMVSVKSTPQTDEAMTALADAVNGNGTGSLVEVLPSLDAGSLAITSARAASLTTLVVGWGAITAEALVQRVNQLSAAGAKQVGIVLTGVPDRLRSEYER